MSKEFVVLANDINKGKVDLSTKTNTELVDIISNLSVEFAVRSAKFLEKGNKSAARDARKVTLGLEKTFKAFRKASV
jgi:ribosomal protein L7Ae-like RNA K-turn-binding protein